MDRLRAQLTEPIQTERLDVERGHDASVYHGLTNPLVLKIPGPGQVSQEPARKAVPGAGRIKNRLQGIGRRGKNSFTVERYRPIFSTLDDQDLRAPIDNPARRFDKIGLLGQLTGFTVINNQNVYLLQGFEQGLSFLLDPEVHCVANHPLRTPDLMENFLLKLRVDVCQEDQIRFPITVRKLRPKLLKHVEVSFQSLRLVELIAVFAFPAKSRSGGPFEAFE